MVGPYKTQMTCYKFSPRDAPSKVYIGTAFPSEAPFDEAEVSI